MRSFFLFTSESVSEGHPDKVADQISDAIVDLFLSKDPEARVACETMTTTQKVVLAGEIRGKGIMDEDGNWAPGVPEEIEQAARETVKRIGYEQDGFHWKTFDFSNNLHPQSAHIAQGVDASGNKDEGAGDQGIMFGFACDETPDLMPATLYYSHKILERMAADRHSGTAPFLEPDAKSQVTLRFENGKPVKATAIVVSTQHGKGYDEGDKEAELHHYVKKVVADVLPAELLDGETVYHINPTGSFEIGGPDGDAGLTGRKIIVDTYGGAPRMAAARSAARTRPRSTARPPMPRATSPRTSSRPVSPSAAPSSSPMRSGSASRFRSMSTRTEPARSPTTGWNQPSARSTCAAALHRAASAPRSASTSRSIRRPQPTAISAERRTAISSLGKRPTSPTS
jgi:S-adenosylmethionine synthetase